MTEATTGQAVGQHAVVRLLTPEQQVAALVPGSIIGRSGAAELRLNDPGVSEAHALVSLRGSRLMLLALRGRFSVNGRLMAQLELAPGASFSLAPGVTFTVLSVALPSAVLAIVGDGLPRLILPPVAALDAAVPTLLPRFSAGADALIWTDGDGFSLRRPGHPDVRAHAGLVFTARERRFELVQVPLAEGAVEATRRDGTHEAPVRFVVRYDSVHILREGTTSVVTGLPARILTELALIRAPAAWASVAQPLWPLEDEPTALRQKWDRALGRLRAQLRGCGLRGDRVRSDHGGLIELVLGPSDRIEDES